MKIEEELAQPEILGKSPAVSLQCNLRLINRRIGHLRFWVMHRGYTYKTFLKNMKIIMYLIDMLNSLLRVWFSNAPLSCQGALARKWGSLGGLSAGRENGKNKMAGTRATRVGLENLWGFLRRFGGTRVQGTGVSV